MDNLNQFMVMRYDKHLVHVIEEPHMSSIDYYHLVVRTGFEPVLSPFCVHRELRYHLRHLTIYPLHQLNGLAAIWEWGFPLIRDSVVRTGIEPVTPWASTKCSTF